MEQCKKNGQDKDAELSFYDLSHTDEVLNQLEILFANTVSNLEKKDDAVEESEYSDSWLYRVVADINTTLKNGTENNVVDVIRFSESIRRYDLDIMDDLEKAVGRLVPYHVGDVTIQPFPELDPEYYKNLCTGVSLYYPISSEKSEIEEYLGICPIKKYAEFLDALYVQIPEVQMQFADKGSVDKDGQFKVQLTDDSADYLKEVGFKVWKQRKKDNNFFMIGTQTISMSDSENLTFNVPFTGEWYYLDGHRLTTKGSWKDGLNHLVAPIMLNDESTDYNFSYTYDDGKITFNKGTVGSQYDENGLIQRDVQFEPLKKGDVVEVISEDIDKRSGLYTIASYHASVSINAVVKLTFCVYRPWIRDSRVPPAGDAITTATGYSFPSGHTTTAALIYGRLAVSTWKKLRWISVLCFICLGLTAFSRNYLGVHTPQDVLVGLAIGTAVLFGMSALFRFLTAHQEKENLLLITGAAFCIAALIYITLKPYPMDYVDSKLLVDPERMNKDRYGDIGMLLALCGARFIEKTWIKYKPTGTKDLWELY